MDDSVDISDIAEVVPLDEGSNVARKLAPRGRPFAKGAVGNPRGRPVGSRNKSTLLAQAYFDEMAKEVVAKALALAMSGDPVALKLCLERILPRRRDTAVMLEDFPEIETAGDCKTAVKTIVRAAASGEISPSEAHALVGLVEAQARMMTAVLGTAEGRTPH